MIDAALGCFVWWKTVLSRVERDRKYSAQIMMRTQRTERSAAHTKSTRLCLLRRSVTNRSTAATTSMQVQGADACCASAPPPPNACKCKVLIRVVRTDRGGAEAMELVANHSLERRNPLRVWHCHKFGPFPGGEHLEESHVGLFHMEVLPSDLCNDSLFSRVPRIAKSNVRCECGIHCVGQPQHHKRAMARGSLTKRG
jgi:hypothetical protein